MFNSYNPYYIMPRTFSFTNILNGASKTLNVLNQALPVYKEIKPIVSNAKTLFNAYRSINNTQTNNIVKTNNSNNSPSFFI